MSVHEMVDRPGSASSFAARGGMDNGMVSLETYRSPEAFELERERIFRRAWLFAGRVEEVPNKADFVVKEFAICKASIIIIRGKDDVLRAFHNVCPHRANLVESRPNGNAPVLVCRYHGWSYSTDGRLRGVPDQEMFLGLDKAGCGLTPVALEIWDGWMFVNLAETPEVSLDEFLGDWKSFYGGVEYNNLDHPIVVETRLNCNWKIVADAFVEAYHIPSIHSTTLKTLFSNDENKYGRLLDARFFGPHRFVSMFGNAAAEFKPGHAIAKLVNDPEKVPQQVMDAAMAYLNHPAVNPTKQPDWSMDIATIFPNVNIAARISGPFVHEYWPLSATETLHRATFYFPRPATVGERFAMEHTIAWLVDIIYEDLGNVERTQRGVESGATRGMNLSESEVSIRHSVQQVEKWIGSATVAEALGRGQ